MTLIGQLQRNRTLWISAALVLLAAALGFVNGLGRADTIFLDGQTRLNERSASKEIVIVAIDERSLLALGRWPWRRSIHAELLQQLARYQPAVVGLDLIFSEPALEHPEDDALLAATLRRSPPTVLPVVMEIRGQRPEAVFPTASIEAAVSRNGHIHVELDQDGVARTVFLREGVRGQWWDHLSLAMIAETPAGSSVAGHLPGARAPDHSIDEPDRESVFWRRDYEMRIPFAGPPGHFNRISYIDVLDGTIDPESLRGKYVLVGVTAAGLGDGYPTPVSGHGVLMPGVELHANVLDALLRNVELRGAEPWQNALFSVFPVLLALLAFHKLRAGFALLAVPLLFVALIVVDHVAQRYASIQFAPAAALLALGLSYPLWSWQRLVAAIEYLAEEIRRAKTADGLLLLPAGAGSGDALQRNMQAMKETIDQTRELRQFVTDSLNGLPDATLVTDDRGAILLANRAAERLCGEGGSTLKGGSIDQTLSQLCGAHLIWPQFQAPEIERRADAEAVVDVEATSRGGRDLLIKFSPWVGSAVLRSGWIVSIIDISGVREAERQRDEAMRFITHDIRAPQSSIVATIDLYRREYEHSPSLHVLERIEKYAMRTLALADEFTRLAQVENRNPAVQPFESVDLSAVVVQAADQFWELARARNVRIDTRAAELSEALVSGNESMLIRAVSNLLSNAVKFSPEGAEVHCSLTQSGPDVLVSVTDQGPGISAEDQKNLFEKFRRFRVRAEEQPDGIGLGLAYVKAVALQHHGSVEVHSFVGQGATFTVTLPGKATAISAQS